jgi:hypothetical protein
LTDAEKASLASSSAFMRISRSTWSRYGGIRRGKA